MSQNGQKTAVKDALSIAALRDAVKGRVIGPDDPGYDEARTPFYGGFDKRPAAIVKVADAADIAAVVSSARENGVELAVRSGGHSQAGHGVSDGGLVIDLGEMKKLDFDLDEGSVWAETGITAGELIAEAGKHGLAVGFGDTGSVGIGGITLGGGVGFMARKFGLTIDDLLAAEIVTADGQLLRIDEHNHPDLFWAIRGGGGNFGVATRFKYRLHEVDEVIGGMLVLPATAQTVAQFMALAEAAPEELSTIANVMKAPPMPFLPPEAAGAPIIMAFIVCVGDLDAAEKAVAPFKAIATPYADMVRRIHYPEMYPAEEAAYHPVGLTYTLFIDTVDEDSAQTMIDYVSKGTGIIAAAQLRVLGGAVSRVADDATAYAHRGRRIMANLAALYPTVEAAEAGREWLDDFVAATRQGASNAYVNFLVDDDPQRVREAYPGKTWERLVEVKRRYDPGNLFHVNQNIPPGEG